MEEKTISLEEFRAKLHEEVERFYKEWMEKEKTFPEHYEHNLTENQWWEQHLAWTDMGGDP